MIVAILTSSRREVLRLELTAQGVDIRRLEFYAWLIKHGRNPELLSQLGGTPASRTTISEVGYARLSDA